MILLLLASVRVSKHVRPGEFTLSREPGEIILVLGRRDMVAGASSRFEILGDGWIQRKLETDVEAGRRAAGVYLQREEVEAAVRDLVDYGVLEADLRQIREAIEPTHGVLPDGRRWVEGSSEPGTDWMIAVHFESAAVRSKLQRDFTLRFSPEPFVRYRAKRPDIPALEGISRFTDRIGPWFELVQGEPRR